MATLSLSLSDHVGPGQQRQRQRLAPRELLLLNKRYREETNLPCPALPPREEGRRICSPAAVVGRPAVAASRHLTITTSREKKRVQQQSVSLSAPLQSRLASPQSPVAECRVKGGSSSRGLNGPALRSVAITGRFILGHFIIHGRVEGGNPCYQRAGPL